MARARTRTKLSLDEWARIVGLNPLHFNQCFIPNQELNAICASSFFQHDWQDNDSVSREQLADAIRQAEENIEGFLGFHLLPSWDVDEWHNTLARPYRPEFFNLLQTDIRGMRTAVVADWGYAISGGIEAKVLETAGRPIVWSDADGDGISETGTVTETVAAAVAAEEVEIYYPGKSGDDTWQIRPVTVVIAAGTATITFRRELALLEALQEDISDPRGQDYLQDGKFLATVDVYRRHNDPSTQATLVWEPWPGCGCGGSCVNCTYTVQTACLLPRYDNRHSALAFSAGTWDATTETFSSDALSVGREPDAVRLWYRSGWRDMRLANKNTQMDRDLAYIVAIYTCSLLDRKVCDCKGVNDGIARWQQDYAFQKGAVQLGAYAFTSCPFGTKFGAVEAWRRLMRPNTPKFPITRPVLA